MNKTTQVAFITGSSDRIGKAIALHLAGLGYDIALHYRRSEHAAEDTAATIRAMGRHAVLVQGDLTDPTRTASLISDVKKTLGQITCLINNASLFEKDALKNFTHENFTAHFAVHAEAPLRLISEFVNQLPNSLAGNVINITDGMNGWSMSDKFLTYSLSKMALGNITQLLARSLAPRVRINTIAPGPTIPGTQDSPDTFSKLEKILPLARVSSPEEVCAAIDYLLSAHSVTGQSIQLSGGIHTLQSLQD